ncbi:hypothetical protein QBC38DRAFT_355235 [Podospora fimiseda]|uniref:Mucin-7 n=1 Tax=Podospora fimiseda TaxID=252190 RepID=A0AAN7BYA3_9PEZI|nr:hypothetical protein QBC38DRAFT_355235 [Podospora fimiseda]
MSAVKNLRAMFEQKGEASPPPERGRSAPGTPFAASTESPRPLSKVRTSFIAIEKDGRMGLQREGSQDSIPGLRKPIDSTASVPTTPITNGREILNPFEKFERLSTPAKTGLKENLKEQSIPESPRADIPDKPLTPPTTDEAVPPAAHTPAPAQTPAPVKSRTTSPVKAPQAVETPKPAGKAPVGGKANGKAHSVKPTIITTKVASNPSAGKSVTKAPRSPTASRAPKSPVAGLAPSLLAKSTPDKKMDHQERTTTPSSSKPAAATHKPLSVNTSPNAGLVKPKPKSPTRPVKLPPSLTTHTAASGLKVHNADPHVRASSRQSLSGGALPAGKTLKRQSSTINRPRPSLGLPPTKPAEDHPPVKKEKEIDEGFLARMMRPTKASASKVHEKVVTSPARKPVAAKKAPATTTTKPVAKKTVPKSTASSRAHSSVGHHAVPVVAEPAVIVEEAPEPVKAEAIEAHNEPEVQTTAAQEVATIVEQVENAEVAIEIAKDAEGEVALPEVPQVKKDSVEDLANNLDELSVSQKTEDNVEPAINGHKADIDTAAAGTANTNSEAVSDAKEKVSETTVV